MFELPIVDIQFASTHDHLPSAHALEACVRHVLHVLDRADVELTIRLVDEEEMTHLNTVYRGKFGPTNVLSFPAEEMDELDVPLLGDIVICADVVYQEAFDQGKSLDAHWAHMVVHGLLHLLGYDHQCHQEAQQMEAQERSLLADLGFKDPYE